MRKFIATFLIVISLVFSVFSIVRAKDVNSYELFWPMVAGRTMKDPLFPLKLLQENIRGYFVFGNAPKAEYHLILATKRFLETEKLISDKENVLAGKSLDKAVGELGVFQNDSTISQNEKSMTTNRKVEIKKKLGNLQIFLPYLAGKADQSLAGGFAKAESLVNQALASLN
jgi:hypothetical protein